jgi:hypothetical protein
MPTWAIIVIVALVLLLLVMRFKRPAGGTVVAVANNNGTGVQLRHLAEKIPFYGGFVQVAGVVGKPVNNILNKATDLQINALKHIPIVGSVAAKPLEIAESSVKKINSWLGL